MEKKLYLISSNVNSTQAGKIRELQSILADRLPIELLPLDLQQIQGTADQIISAKLKVAIPQASGPVIVQDTSLCLHALQGLPGPYMQILHRKWFSKSIGASGIHKMLEGFQDKSATAQCRIGFCQENGEPQIFLGQCEGRIVAPRGQNGFGWDPCFQPEGFNLTFAEMDEGLKNQISHRARSTEAFKKFLEENW